MDWGLSGGWGSIVLNNFYQPASLAKKVLEGGTFQWTRNFWGLGPIVLMNFHWLATC